MEDEDEEEQHEVSRVTEIKQTFYMRFLIARLVDEDSLMCYIVTMGT